MDYKELYEKAFSSVTETYPCSDHETALNNVKERAKNMKTGENVHQAKIREISVERYEPKKSTRIIHAFAGIAGTAAVLTGAVFGIRWLNENGGLKGPDVQGAGYHEDSDPAQTTAVTTNALISDEEIDKPGTYRYDNCTLYVRDYTFDGMCATLYYDVVFDDPSLVSKENKGFLEFKPSVENNPEGNDVLTEFGLNYNNWLLTIEDGTTIEYPNDRPDTVCVTEKMVTMMPTDSVRIAFLTNKLKTPEAYDEALASGKYDYTINRNVFGSYITKTADIQIQSERLERLVRVNICADCIELVYDEVDNASLDTLFGSEGVALRTLYVKMKDGSSFKLAPPPGEAIFNKAYGLNNVAFSYYLIDTPIDPAQVGSIYLGETAIYGEDENSAEADNFANNMTIDDTIDFSDCTVNVSGAERYGNTVKLTLDVYAKENCDMNDVGFCVYEYHEVDEPENRVYKATFSDLGDADNGHLREEIVFFPDLPEGMERTYMLRKYHFASTDNDEFITFTVTGEKFDSIYTDDYEYVGEGIESEEIRISSLRIDPLTISFRTDSFNFKSLADSFNLSPNFSVKLRSGETMTYDKGELTDDNGNTICSFSSGTDDTSGEDIRYIFIATKPIFDVNEIESINILGAEIPITIG